MDGNNSYLINKIRPQRNFASRNKVHYLIISHLFEKRKPTNFLNSVAQVPEGGFNDRNCGGKGGLSILEFLKLKGCLSGDAACGKVWIFSQIT